MLTIRFTPALDELVYDIDSLSMLAAAEASAKERGSASHRTLEIEVCIGALDG